MPKKSMEINAQNEEAKAALKKLANMINMRHVEK
jgi:hypothetical protein